MKTLAIIWITAMLVGVFTIHYISNAMSVLIIKPVTAYQIQPAQSIDLGNSVCLQACNEPNIQPAKPIN